MKHYLETEIIPRYETFDKAHRTEHVRQVIAESLKLASYYVVDERMVYAVAAYHDIGLCEGREHHHLVSGRMMRADSRLREWFSEEEIEVMAQAVEDHRACSQKHLRTHCSRSRSSDRTDANPSQDGAIWTLPLSRTLQRPALFPLLRTLAREICRRRLSQTMDSRV